MNSNSINQSQAAYSAPLIHSPEMAKQRVSDFIGHAVKMLDSLKTQHTQVTDAAGSIEKIYQDARQEIKKIEDQIKDQDYLKGDKPLEKKQIKELAKVLKDAEKTIARVIREAKIKVAGEIGSQSITDQTKKTAMQTKIEALARGGWSARLIKLFSFTSKTNEEALKTFKKTISEMNHMPVELKEKADAVELKRRAGVVGHNGLYYIQTNFSEKGIRKQFNSFLAQVITQETPRTTISKELTIETKKIESKDELEARSSMKKVSPVQVQVKSSLVPLNKEFDELLHAKGLTTETFAQTFGKAGASSLDRQRTDLINAWESRLEHNGKSIYRAIRHAITSDKYETNLDRRKLHSKMAAEQLVKAAVLQELADKGLTLEQAAKQEVKLNFNSVSLVTPDDIRAIGTGRANEKYMLRDQIEALKSFVGKDKLIVIDNKEIKINIQVNTFNFGVNAGAMYGFGALNQYTENRKALMGLEQQWNALIEQNLVIPEEKAHLVKSAMVLFDDIKYLMRSPTAYIKSDNQYEVGAKIINFTNLLNELNGSGYKCAFNCMSGKDRTGMMDAIAKAYAQMAAINGIYPTHKQLAEEEYKAQFRDILIPILLEAGGLEITQLNTGARGYKVTKHALVSGLSQEYFLKITGLSQTTSS